MVKKTRHTAVVAGMIYFIQGTLGISSIALPLYMRSLGWTISEIAAVTSLAALPWIFKIFYGFLSDSVPFAGYRRKSYLILFALLSASGWLLLALLPSSKQGILLAMMLTNTGFAAIDVITDGFVVEHSLGVASSVYQAVAWGSRSAGSVMAGFLSGWLASHWESGPIFYLTMMLPLLVCGCALLMNEKRTVPETSRVQSEPLKRCREFLSVPELKYYALVLLLVSISSSFAVPFFFHMKETLQFPETFLGMLTSLGWAGAGIGSLVYMFWLRRLSVESTLRWAMIFNALNILSTLLIQGQISAFAVIFLSGVMGCLVMLPIVSSLAAVTRSSGMQSTLFAVLMSVFNVGQILFGFLGGKIFNWIGLAPLIFTAGAVAISGLFFTGKLSLVKETA